MSLLMFALYYVGIASGVYAYLLWAAPPLPCKVVEGMFPEDRRQTSDIGGTVETSGTPAPQPHAA